MRAVSLPVPAAQQTAAAAPASSTSADTIPVNHNGPQCAHCGWRGGGHASNCPFSRFLHTHLRRCADVLLRVTCSPAVKYLRFVTRLCGIATPSLIDLLISLFPSGVLHVDGGAC
ncbi:hypothetical protein FB451DRAFT_1563773 [Mycena latifolia]|nr:hypothetical protein FB451DRAFT_1563773 [Mycena latifolia]